MGINTIEEAETLLARAGEMNPGPWINHSINVGRAARIICEKSKAEDPDLAYRVGILHDIGRMYGRSHIKHVYDGYKYFQGIDDLASEICLSHTFPSKNINEYQGEMDLEKCFLDEIEMKLNIINYDFLHYLIILCDGYGFTNGFISLEKRWIDAAIRLGINEHTINKWKKMYEIRDEINIKYGINIEKELGILS